MPEHALIKRIARWRMLGAFAAVTIVAAAATLSGGVAQGRVAPFAQQSTATQILPDTIAVVTGGGTVMVTAIPNVVASFGINGKRPAGFVQDGTGAALGRINYDKHGQVPKRHVNVPITFMSVELNPNPSPNGTGGRAQLVGDCMQANVECPSNLPAFESVLVYVEDNSDNGVGDFFQISYCTGPAQASPTGCTLLPPEGGTIRSGNIQIRANASGGSAQVPTAARAPLRVP